MFCGILFTIHDTLAGYYPGYDRFESNLINNSLETSLAGIIVAFYSFHEFVVFLILLTLILLEFMRGKYAVN